MRLLGLLAGAILIFSAIAVSWPLFVEYPDDFQAGMPEEQQQAKYQIYLVVWSVAAVIGTGGVITIVYAARSGSNPSLYQPDRNNRE